MPPSKSKSQGGKAKNDWGDFTESDSDAGSDEPRPKDEPNDAEGEEATPVQHSDDPLVSPCTSYPVALPCLPHKLPA